jgi:hypothetical protein
MEIIKFLDCVKARQKKPDVQGEPAKPEAQGEPVKQ